MANDAAEDFHFVVVSDRTGGARPGVFASAIPKVNVLEPAFVVSVGDLIEGYTEDQARIDGEWDEFEGFIEQLEVPFFYAAGNHDMSNAAMAETWQARFGPSFYRFVYKDVLFLVLNSELFGMVSKPDTAVPGPWTQAEQLAFVERTLAEVPDPRWTIVVVHQPLWDYASGVRGDWPKVESMLADRDYTVFAGHFHHYVKAVRQDRNYITLATTGGGSSLRGNLYGEFDHVALVTMTADGPRIANLMLDGVHDEDLLTEDVRDAMRWLDDAVQSVPMPGEGPAFTDGRAGFQVANAGDRDLAVSLHVDPGPDLLYTGTAQAMTIAAGDATPVHVSSASGRTPPVSRHPARTGLLVAGRPHRRKTGGFARGVRIATRGAFPHPEWRCAVGRREPCGVGSVAVSRRPSAGHRLGPHRRDGHRLCVRGSRVRRGSVRRGSRAGRQSIGR